MNNQLLRWLACAVLCIGASIPTQHPPAWELVMDRSFGILGMVIALLILLLST